MRNLKLRRFLNNSNLFSKIGNGLIIAIVLIATTSCQKKQEPIGPLSSEARTLEGEFEALYVDQGLNVTVGGGDSTQISVTAYAGDHENVFSEVQNETLLLQAETGSFDNVFRKVDLITFPLSRISMAGDGELTMSGLIYQNLDFTFIGTGISQIELEANAIESNHAGAGTAYWAGQTSVFSVNQQSNGSVDARDLRSESCKVVINGSGDAYVNVTQNLTVIFNGTGNVYYRGPVTNIIAIYNGGGELIRIP